MMGLEEELHTSNLGDFWVPMLVFGGVTLHWSARDCN